MSTSKVAGFKKNHEKEVADNPDDDVLEIGAWLCWRWLHGRERTSVAATGDLAKPRRDERGVPGLSKRRGPCPQAKAIAKVAASVADRDLWNAYKAAEQSRCDCALDGFVVDLIP